MGKHDPSFVASIVQYNTGSRLVLLLRSQGHATLLFLWQLWEFILCNLVQVE